ncbi:MAG: PTS sugar transporter subunit IIC [Lachnospiraceae bacterium]|nr:PTS sugar transporter subunit IIC [Lachnospiraceae bacterium]
MKKFKDFMNEIFIDGLSGMALGLFATLLVGTILGQIGNLIGGAAGTYISAVANVAKTITGAGIGVGVAAKFKQGPLVTVSAAVCGMIGAFPTVTALEGYAIGKGGEPLGAFVAAVVAIEFGRLVAGKTKVDILVTPIVSICTGALAGIIIGPPISAFMGWLGQLVNFNVEAHPLIGGIIVSVLMGMILTLPISSAAIGISMGISSLAAGAATVGCCCQMVGFAVASYKENGPGGLVAQGLGTSMLQIPNIVRNPLIWIPSILSSAILGPVSSCILKMVSSPVGSGMGSCGLVGQIALLQTMSETTSVGVILAEIAVMHFLLPGVLTYLFASFMYKKGWIKSGDMKLEV